MFLTGNVPFEILLRNRAAFICDVSYCAVGIAMGIPPMPIRNRRNKCRTWAERLERNRDAIEAINHEIIFLGAMPGAAILEV